MISACIQLMKDLGNCKTHTNHCYLGTPSGAGCRDGNSLYMMIALLMNPNSINLS